MKLRLIIPNMGHLMPPNYKVGNTILESSLPSIMLLALCYDPMNIFYLNTVFLDNFLKYLNCWPILKKIVFRMMEILWTWWVEATGQISSFLEISAILVFITKNHFFSQIWSVHFDTWKHWQCFQIPSRTVTKPAKTGFKIAVRIVWLVLVHKCYFFFLENEYSKAS